LPENLKKRFFSVLLLGSVAKTKDFRPDFWRKMLARQNNWTRVSAFVLKNHIGPSKLLKYISHIQIWAFSIALERYVRMT
jgi:hypothetical protein